VKPSSGFHPVTWERVILHHNLSLVRVLSQEKHGASLKVAKDPPSVNQKNTTFWIFELGFIENLP
jgi:hypothetical protein